MSFGLITTPLSLSTDKIRAQICEQKNIAISNFDIQYILLQNLVKILLHIHTNGFMKIKIKWKPFIGLLSPPFSYPPYLPFTPLFQRPPLKTKFVLEKLAHIIETIVVESLTLSLKSSLLNHPLPPFQAPKFKFGDFCHKIGNFFLFELYYISLSSQQCNFEKEQKFTNTIWH